MSRVDIPPETPHYQLLNESSEDILADGGSCIASPDGEWVIPPVVGKERLITGTIDHQKVRQERQNFDPSGHYARPDVLQLHVNRSRQSTIIIKD